MNELTIQEINEAWTELLSQYLIANLSLKKQNAALEMEARRLRDELLVYRQAEKDGIAREAKAIIDGV